METNTKTDIETTQRGLRLPLTIDDWLKQKAGAGGFRSVPEFILHIIRERKAQEERSSDAVAA